MPDPSFNVLCLRAKQAVAEGRLEAARQHYHDALALDGQQPDVHHQVAAVCFQLDDLEAAAFHFKEVTRLDPIRPGAYINLGAVLNSLAELDEAIRVLRRAVQLEPHRAEGFYNLGLAYRNSDLAALAEQAYLEALRINPRMFDAHLNLANLYRETGRLDEAIDCYREVLAVRPNWERARIALREAEAAVDRRRSGIAEPSTDESARLDPADALRRLARAGEIHGRRLVEVLEDSVFPSLAKQADPSVDESRRAAFADAALAEFRAAQRDWMQTLADARSYTQQRAAASSSNAPSDGEPGQS